VPIAGEDDRDHRLGEQEEGRDDRQQERRWAAAVQGGVADRGERVEETSRDRQRDERAPDLLRRNRVVEWGQGRQ
jgi:hypothetical protein